MTQAEEGLKGYFPKAESRATLLDDRHVDRMPPRPLAVELYDQDLVSQPLAEFDQRVYDAGYAQRPPGEDADKPPLQPAAFADPYLMPSLTAHERMRLTMLWYHTRDIVQDTAFMLSLQEQLNLVKLFMGWEIAIMGLLSEDVYSRLVAVGAPLAILPRRESTCSHTVNQQPGVSRSPFGFCHTDHPLTH